MPFRLQKKVDYVLTVILKREEIEFLMNSFHVLPLEARSINQHLTLPYHPIFLPIEVKRLHQPRDPLIQLAVWISAWYKKNIQMGYDTSMPVPAISVDEDIWTLWIAYWREEKRRDEGESSMKGRLVILGPTIMGTTMTWSGVFQVLKTLKRIGNWGLEVYGKWVKKVVLRIIK